MTQTNTDLHSVYIARLSPSLTINRIRYPRNLSPDYTEPLPVHKSRHQCFYNFLLYLSIVLLAPLFLIQYFNRIPHSHPLLCFLITCVLHITCNANNTFLFSYILYRLLTVEKNPGPAAKMPNLSAFSNSLSIVDNLTSLLRNLTTGSTPQIAQANVHLHQARLELSSLNQKIIQLQDSVTLSRRQLDADSATLAFLLDRQRDLTKLIHEFTPVVEPPAFAIPVPIRPTIQPQPTNPIHPFILDHNSYPHHPSLPIIQEKAFRFCPNWVHEKLQVSNFLQSTASPENLNTFKILHSHIENIIPVDSYADVDGMGSLINLCRISFSGKLTDFKKYTVGSEPSFICGLAVENRYGYTAVLIVSHPNGKEANRFICSTMLHFLQDHQFASSTTSYKLQVGSSPDGRGSGASWSLSSEAHADFDQPPDFDYKSTARNKRTPRIKGKKRTFAHKYTLFFNSLDPSDKQGYTGDLFKDLDSLNTHLTNQGYLPHALKHIPDPLLKDALHQYVIGHGLMNYHKICRLCDSRPPEIGPLFQLPQSQSSPAPGNKIRSKTLKYYPYFYSNPLALWLSSTRLYTCHMQGNTPSPPDPNLVSTMTNFFEKLFRPVPPPQETVELPPITLTMPIHTHPLLDRIAPIPVPTPPPSPPLPIRTDSLLPSFTPTVPASQAAREKLTYIQQQAHDAASTAVNVVQSSANSLGEEFGKGAISGAFSEFKTIISETISTVKSHLSASLAALMDTVSANKHIIIFICALILLALCGVGFVKLVLPQWFPPTVADITAEAHIDLKGVWEIICSTTANNFLKATDNHTSDTKNTFKETPFMTNVRDAYTVVSLIQRVDNLANTVNTYIRALLDWASTKITDTPFFKNSQDVQSYQTQVRNMMSALDTNNLTSLAQKKEFIKTYESLVQHAHLLFKIDQPMHIAASNIIFRLQSTFLKLKSEVCTEVPRQRPTSAWFAGESGIGKSFAQEELPKALFSYLQKYHEDAFTDIHSAKWSDSLVHTRRFENEFWEGYHEGHWAVKMDDIFQSYKPEDRGLEALSVISIVNDAPYPLHMAAIESKASTYFQSKLFIMSSNLAEKDLVNIGISHPPAFSRRRDFIINVHPHPTVKKDPYVANTLQAFASMRFLVSQLDPSSNTFSAPSVYDGVSGWLHLIKDVAQRYMFYHDTMKRKALPIEYSFDDNIPPSNYRYASTPKSQVYPSSLQSSIRLDTPPPVLPKKPKEEILREVLTTTLSTFPLHPPPPYSLIETTQLGTTTTTTTSAIGVGFSYEDSDEGSDVDRNQDEQDSDEDRFTDLSPLPPSKITAEAHMFERMKTIAKSTVTTAAKIGRTIAEYTMPIPYIITSEALAPVPSLSLIKTVVDPFHPLIVPDTFMEYRVKHQIDNVPTNTDWVFKFTPRPDPENVPDCTATWKQAIKSVLNIPLLPTYTQYFFAFEKITRSNASHNFYYGVPTWNFLGNSVNIHPVLALMTRQASLTEVSILQDGNPYNQLRLHYVTHLADYPPTLISDIMAKTTYTPLVRSVLEKRYIPFHLIDDFRDLRQDLANVHVPIRTDWDYWFHESPPQPTIAPVIATRVAARLGLVTSLFATIIATITIYSAITWLLFSIISFIVNFAARMLGLTKKAAKMTSPAHSDDKFQKQAQKLFAKGKPMIRHSADPVPDPPLTAEAHGFQALSDLTSILAYNTTVAKFNFVSGFSFIGFMFCIEGSIWAIPRHFQLMGPLRTIEISGTVFRPFEHIVTVASNEHFFIHNTTDRDLSFLYIPGVQPYRSLTKHLRTRKEAASLNGVSGTARISLIDSDLVDGVFGVTSEGVIHHHVNTAIDSTLQGVKILDYTEVYIANGLPSTAGQCSLPVITTNSAIERKLLGINTGGSEKSSMVAPIYTEDIELMRQKIEEVRKTSPIHGIAHCPIEFAEALKVPITPIVEKPTAGYFEGMPVFATIDKGGNWPQKTKLIPTPVQTGQRRKKAFIDPPYERLTAPAMLRKQGGSDIDPLSLSFRKEKGRRMYFGLDLCSPDLWKGIFTKYFDGFEYRILTLEEAINGIPHLGNFHGIALDTCAGHPFAQYHYTRGDLIIRDSSHTNVSPFVLGTYPSPDMFVDQTTPGLWVHPDLQTAIYMTFYHAKLGLVTPAYFLYCLKDELRPLERVAKGYTRGFAMGSIHHLIFCRMVMGLVISTIEKGVDHDICVTANPYSSDWTRMFSILSSFGNNFWSHDIDGWDINFFVQKFCPGFLYAIHHFLRIPLHSFEYNCFTTVTYSTLYGRYVIRTLIIIRINMPSGAYVTTIFNSMANSVKHRRIWKQVSNEPFDEHNAMKVGGDDSVLSTDNSSKDIFNGLVVSKLAKEIFNHTHTSSTKGEVTLPFDEPDSTVFFKRPFKLTSGVALAPLDPITLESMPQWIMKPKNGMSYNEQFKQNCHNALHEWALHPKEQFEKHLSILNGFLAEFGPTFLYPQSYEERMALLTRTVSQ